MLTAPAPPNPCCTPQAALAPRLAGYPARALQQMHVAHALVPAAVAHLLRTEPQLLAAAVEAFHYRDPDDVKVRSEGGGPGCGPERDCPGWEWLLHCAGHATRLAPF